MDVCADGETKHESQVILQVASNWKVGDYRYLRSIVVVVTLRDHLATSGTVETPRLLECFSPEDMQGPTSCSSHVQCSRVQSTYRAVDITVVDCPEHTASHKIFKALTRRVPFLWLLRDVK